MEVEPKPFGRRKAMKEKKHWILVGVLGICGLVALAEKHEPDALDRIAAEKSQSFVPQPTMTWAEEKDTLAGLQGVWVYIDLRSEIGKHGLTKQILQTDVELQLRRNGIRVLSEDEWAATPGRPFLLINVSGPVSEEIEVAAQDIAVTLQQDVILLRDQNIWCNAVTWGMHTAGMVSLKDHRKLRGIIKDLIDTFSNSYLAANPKTEGSKNNK